MPFKNNLSVVNRLKLYAGDYNSKIIMGDFNSNLLSNDGTYLRDLTNELDMKLVDDGPTHFATSPATWIDAIFVDSNDTIIDKANRPALYPNFHNFITVTLDRSIPLAPSESYTYRAFANINANDLNAFLMSCDWSPVDSDSGAPDLMEMLAILTDLTSAIDTLAPPKTVSP